MAGVYSLLRLWILLILHCLIIPSADSLPSCPALSVRCNQTQTCIDSKYLCDGDDDCGNGEDELNCDVKDSGCGDLSNQTGISGTITSMGYPANYIVMADCKWFIHVPVDHVLVFTFVEPFDLEKAHYGQCLYDSVSVYQEEPLQLRGQFCGSMTPGQLVVDSNNAIVEFHSDRQTNGQGFKLHWAARKLDTNDSQASITQPTMSTTKQPVCGDVVEVTSGFGRISSPLYANSQPYPAPIFCRWRINVPSADYITLNFDFLDVGVANGDSCSDDWLEVYDGQDENSSLIGQYCGSKLPAVQTSSTNQVFIIMRSSNNSDSHLGFTLSYTAFIWETNSSTLGPPPPGCKNDPILLSATSGYITSPGFSQSQAYRNQLDCQWILQAAPGNVFYFTFIDFELEYSGDCSFDSLSVYDVNNNTSDNGDTSDDGNATAVVDEASRNSSLTEIARLCGAQLPDDIESGGSRVVVKFRSDGQVGGIGFNLSYLQHPPSVKCPDEEFQCGNSSRCIQYGSVCDDVDDCDDGSDELICPSASNCGRPAIQATFSRIVGGTEAVKGSWPWTVSIVNSKVVANSHDCGATLILPQWVITAAHCFDNFDSRDWVHLSVIAGRHQASTPDTHEQIRAFDHVFKRRDYDMSKTLNDFALVKLKAPFNLTDYVDLACLPKDPPAPGQLCYISGWGETLDTCCAGKLKQAAVPIINSSICASDDYLGNMFLEHMMCAGYAEGGTDSCNGDSGGPLVCENQVPDRHWELQGVTSWGIMCAEPHMPGVYAVVHDYIKWVQQTIALNTP